MNRRDFIRLLGLAGGASVLDSCAGERQTEKIIPYLVPPDDGSIPGVAHYVNTTSLATPEGCGIAAKVMDYRVGKLEGLTGHPINDGALDARGQAALANLYHPDRLKTPQKRSDDGSFEPITWAEAYKTIGDAVRASSDRKHQYLTGRTTGALSDVIDQFCAASGVERLPGIETYSYAAIREANRIVFGRAEVPHYDIEHCDFLLTIGADILETFASPVSHGKQFGRAKKRSDFSWYHVEPTLSLTGLNAKKRFAARPGTEAHILAFLLRKVSRANLAGERHISNMIDRLPNLSDRGFMDRTGLTVEQLNEIAKQFLRARRPLVIAGGVSTMQNGGLDIAVMTALLQWASGMVGSTVDFARAQDYNHVGSWLDIGKLVSDLDANRIGTLFVSDLDVGANPVDGRLGAVMGKAKLRVGMDQFMTDTMAMCDIVLPLSDPLESWGDAQPRRGLTSVIQPVIEPLYDTLTEGDILLQLMPHVGGAQAAGSYQDFVFRRWGSKFSSRQIERLLDKGFIEETETRVSVSMNRADTTQYISKLQVKNYDGKPLVYITPSLRAFDGRLRHIALLNEVPDPLTTVSWGEWVSVDEVQARELGVSNRDEVELEVGKWRRKLPVVVQPGLPQGVVTIQYTGAPGSTPGQVLADSGEMNTRIRVVAIKKTQNVVALPILSGSTSQEGRGIIPSDHHGDKKHHHDPEASLYTDNKYRDYRWGMAIDLDLCTGCSACAVACYVENNVPVVGAEQHMMGREMSWLRLEPFYEEGDAEIQPMLCQHCANAPCETVCPVYATYHNEEGLNAQVYNRCVGTRYCANNCPYKVRRFNWYDHDRPGDLNSTRNPEVSVRGAGIMEKCSFCVQRIRAGRDQAKDAGRKIQDGEVTPACAQTCPTNAITFGNLLDDNSEVSKWAHSERSYRVLEPLGVGPAVHYLRNKWKSDHA